MTYINAKDLEDRLAEKREVITEKEDSYNTARELSGYDTAVDVATCYPVRGGDIWHMLPMHDPEIGVPVLVALEKDAEPYKVVIAIFDGDGCFHQIHSSDMDDEPDNVHVYAWAELPDMPELMFSRVEIEEGDDDERD